jgi:glycerol-3-phosphate acyltransferase PlsY
LTILYLFIGLVSYLLGSIPAGYLVGRLRGIDIRKVGSGNIGATNVLRVMGRPYGYGVFVFDFLKGIGAVVLSAFILNRDGFVHPQTELVGIAAGVMSVIGHVYPVWLGFKGGKGVATSIGVLFGLMPIAGVTVIIVWLIFYQTTKYVSVASIAAAVALPLTAAGMFYLEKTKSLALVYFSICLAVMIIWRHRSNISRLTKGTEQSFKRK